MKRGLLLEPLESRHLLAGDVFHNFFLPEDVNGDGTVTPIDALRGINELSRGVTGAVADFLDVNADGQLTPIDPLIVLNNVARGEGVASNVPLADRITRLEQAIESDSVPSRFGIQRAQEILETLRHGGRPEIGEVITSDRLDQLRTRLAAGETPVVDAVFHSLGIRSTDNVVDEVESALQRFGIDITSVSDAVQNLVSTLPDNTAQFGDRIVEILNNLGDEGSELGDRLSNLLDSEDVRAITNQVEAILADSGVDVDRLEQSLQSFVSSIADDGVAIGDAIVALIDGDLNADTLRDGILNLLQSEELTRVRAQVEAQLNDFGVDITNVQKAVNDFTARLAAGETPVRDWIAGFIATDQASGVAAQLFAESELLGDNIDDLIDAISADVTTISQSVNTLVSDLTGGNSSVGQFVDGILSSISSGTLSSDIGSLVDNILGDVDGFLESLFPIDGFLDDLFDRLFG